ncbi:nucleotide exchange factor GrpE [Aerosakkonema funiforme]|uniref:nucleotide exchange factor GrpE n=1 Tax=Aerosakkonema funiforme TaxID=1246630 RepID=UPI0035B6E1F4
MDSYFALFETFSPWILLILGTIFWLLHNQKLQKQRLEELDLAYRVEAIARKLSELSPEAPEQSQNEIVTSLRSTYSLLERLSEKEAISENFQKKVIPENYSEPPEKLLQLSGTAKELIKVRDWVLLAKTGSESIKPEMFDSLYRQLGQVLEKEGVTSLEETGTYDVERQQIVGTQPTNDPSLDEQICETIRPGYLFQGRLIRSQEVVIYTT